MKDYTNDISQLNITARLITEEALRRGYKVDLIRNRTADSTSLIRCEKNNKEFYYRSLYTALTPSYAIYASDDKTLSQLLLERNNVPVPSAIVVVPETESEMAEEFLKVAGEVVVKPANLNHGDGITVGVKTEAELKKAMELARSQPAALSGVLIQQMVSGEEYRFLVLHGKVVAVATRRPPYVIGDGVSTIRSLIEILNVDPQRSEGHATALTKISLGDVAQHNPKGFLEMIPAAGVHVNVLKTTNLSRGGYAIDCTDIASPEIKRIAIEAAKSCLLEIAGVDIITRDITANSTKGSYVIEVNNCPGIRMHVTPTIGKGRDVAKALFSAIEKTAHPIKGKLKHIGRVEEIVLPVVYGQDKIKARIDSGATVASLWASNIEERSGRLYYTLFGPSSALYNGKVHYTDQFSKRIVTSSMGHTQERYQIKTSIIIKGKRIRATFTLADRSKQIYPVLIGRNVLRNKFIIDVSHGKIDKSSEQERRRAMEDGENV